MPAPQKASFAEFLWNREEKTVLGRTGLSWFKITVFYIIFYSCLAAFWSLCLFIFLQTISYKEPRWNTNTGSIIGKNPGLGFRPRPPAERIESTLVMFNEGPGENWGHWVSELTNVTEKYKQVPEKYKKNMKTCNYGDEMEGDDFCVFNIEELGPKCRKDRNFGYEAGNPCIIVKLNKIFNWRPDVYATSDDLPDNMPESVREVIAREFTEPGSNEINKQNVWITCEGENPNDFENIGQVNYYPHPGMPAYYYPFQNQPGYQSPLVAVEFASVKRGVLLNIECKAWAKNIFHDRKERKGSVHLELMVD
ncbi:Sodium/potassium-transporting ATPase subunit beta [Amphibalanus amphitrite]|uniref:Sodium/potassium-transporting ATPase subunit beta n=1 Tax=Amphibalanus amphitrite TaxID=1232801 RepID=A0A6A4VXR9_AMPAM|nr:Sodium/potassium-transporting ATPase subunit beta [Amphibalanus amphitrite]